MGAFEDLHRDRVLGSLAMFDRMIFKGHLSALYKQDGDVTLWWEGDTPINCGDCGVPLDRTEAVPRDLGTVVGPICMRCRDVRQELDALLD